MMTTCLTQGRPYRLPFAENEERLFFFRRRDLDQLFPREVVDWMAEHGRPAADGRPEDEFLPMPLGRDLPVVVATRMERVYDKLVSNIQEVRARGAHVIAIASDGNEDIQHHADDVIYVPKAPAYLSAILAVIPLQLLAYRIARLRGLNVDQPRNLAKTVTVE